jgi:anti-sigma28 factor (negative regulator of flagellin synthesis)
MVQGSGKIPEQLQSIAKAVPQVPVRKPSVPIEKKPAPATDQVTLSAKARQVQAMSAKVESVPEVRQDKVAEVQAKMKAKTVQAPAAKMAEKLLLEN